MRTRNIKLNIFLDEYEKDMLIKKSNKLWLSQSGFVRKLILDYTSESISKSNIENIKSTIMFAIDNLIKLNIKMEWFGYYQIVEFIKEVLCVLLYLVNETILPFK